MPRRRRQARPLPRHFVVGSRSLPSWRRRDSDAMERYNEQTAVLKSQSRSRFVVEHAVQPQ